MPDEAKTRDTIVAFFDILGYREVLRNNDPEYVLNFIRKSRMKDDECIAKFLQSRVKNPAIAAMLKEAVTRFYVSDSILLSIAYPGSSKPKTKQFCWSLILFRSILLYRFLLDQGLPVRGAIAFGPAAIAGDIYAGKCIVDAYEHTQQLELAAVVLHPTAEEEFRKLGDDKPDESLCRQHRVPLKDSRGVEHLVLLPTPLEANYPTKLPSDIRGYVLQAFLKLNKPLSPRDCVKLDNTVRCLEFFRNSCPHLFADAASGGATGPRP